MNDEDQGVIDELNKLETVWSSYSQPDKDDLSGLLTSVIQGLTQASQNPDKWGDLSNVFNQYELQDPHSWRSEKMGKRCTLALRAGVFAIFLGVLWGAIAVVLSLSIAAIYAPFCIGLLGGMITVIVAWCVRESLYKENRVGYQIDNIMEQTRLATLTTFTTLTFHFG